MHVCQIRICNVLWFDEGDLNVPLPWVMANGNTNWKLLNGSIHPRSIYYVRYEKRIVDFIEKKIEMFSTLSGSLQRLQNVQHWLLSTNNTTTSFPFNNVFFRFIFLSAKNGAFIVDVVVVDAFTSLNAIFLMLLPFVPVNIFFTLSTSFKMVYFLFGEFSFR